MGSSVPSSEEEVMENLLRAVEWLRSGEMPRSGSALELTAGARLRFQGLSSAFLRCVREGREEAAEDRGFRGLDAYVLRDDRPTEKLFAARAALPGPGEAGTADLLSLLPDAERGLLAQGACLNATPPTPAELSRIPVVRNVQAGEYAALLSRMTRAGMLHWFRKEDAVVENGVFGVPKTAKPGGPQRVIWDGRRSNLFFKTELASVVLPSPDMFGELLLEPGANLYMSTSDISQMYNRLRAPRWLWRFFGLPRIWGPTYDSAFTSEFYYPCLTVIPMGWNLAVRFAQAVHLEILRRCGFPDSVLVLRGKFCPTTLRDRLVAVLPYIDDLAVAGTDAEVVNSTHAVAKVRFGESGLPIHEEKDNPATEQELKKRCLGMHFHRNGLIRPSASYLFMLLVDTSTLLESGGASPADMQRFLGRWVWVLMLCRPLLSVLSELYAHAALPRPATFRCFNSLQVSELRALIGLSPLILRDTTRTPSRRIYCTDASPWGAGVVYTDIQDDSSEGFLHLLRDARTCAGWYAIPTPDGERCRNGPMSDSGLPGSDLVPKFRANFDSGPPIDRRRAAWTGPHAGPTVTLWGNLRWKLVVAHRWRSAARARHINILEVEALVLALRHMQRSSVTSGKRIVVFIDSLVALGALSKGRSASRRLNRTCRKVAAHSFLADVELLLHWVPTAQQPADAASRRYAPRGHRH